MPTEPLKKILDRDFAKAGARDFIELASPLLRELVHHATHAFERCQVASDKMGGVDEDIGPFCLYRTIMDSVDAIDELVRESCGLGTQPVIRTAFEAVVSLEYVNGDDSARCGLAWFYAYLLNRKRTYELLKSTTPSGRTFAAAWERQFGAAFQEPRDVDKAIANLAGLLSKPHFAPIACEFKRMRKKIKRLPRWYSLFGGPENLRALAKSANREADYDFVYRYWSSIAHAHDASSFLTRCTDGSPAFWGMRYPGGLPQSALLAATFLLSATRSMLKRYCQSEDMASWYKDEIKPSMDRLRKTEFEVNALEED